MIVLDTNVVSEPTKPRPSPAVLDWLDRQALENLYLTTVSVAELLVGVDALPKGRRKRGLAEGLDGLIEKLFGPRILPFDRKAAAEYAAAVRNAKANGYTLSVGDAQIAAIARHRGSIVATRDREPFEAAGVKVIHPWEA